MNVCASASVGRAPHRAAVAAVVTLAWLVVAGCGGNVSSKGGTVGTGAGGGAGAGAAGGSGGSAGGAVKQKFPCVDPLAVSAAARRRHSPGTTSQSGRYVL